MNAFCFRAGAFAGLFFGMSLALLAADVRLDVDCSDSMNQKHKAEYAKAAAQLFVAMLDEDAVLQVVAFNSLATPSPLFRMSEPGKRDEAIRWIGRLTIGGGTDYRASLSTASPPDNGVTVFLSDGEHNGTAEPVLDELKKRFVGRSRLYCVSVDCAAGSAAEQLLTRMASTTGGSYTRVEKSEQLVSTFADIAVRIGKLRTYRPTEREVRFRAGHGHILALGFDGDVDVATSHAARSQRAHSADLPGEDVALQAAEVGSATDVIVRLTQPRTKDSRLVGIYRDDLPSANLTVDTQAGRASVGGQLAATIAFENSGRPAESQPLANVAGEVQVRDADGRVLNTVATQTCPEKGCLTAMIPLPKTPGPVTLRGISTIKTREGQSFVQHDDVTVVVEEPARLTINPESVSRQSKPGPFNVELDIALDGKATLPATATAKLAKDVSGLRLIQSDFKQGRLDLRFVAERAGRYQGELVISATSSTLVEPKTIPLTVEVETSFRGLSLSDMRDIDIGTYPAGHGRLEVALRFPTEDDEPAKYDLVATDLSSTNIAIPLRLQADEVITRKNAAGETHAIVQIGNVAAGDYSAIVTASAKKSVPQREWKTCLKLTISEPLSGADVDLGDVEIGDTATGQIKVSNSAKSAMSDITLTAPTRFRDQADATSSEISVSISPTKFQLDKNSERAIPVEVTIAPTCMLRGPISAQMPLRRGEVETRKMSIRLNVVERGQGAAVVQAAPAKLTLKGEPREVVQFQVLLKGTVRLKGPVSLTASLVDRDSTGQQKILVADFHWPDDKPILRPKESLELKGFVLAPPTPGKYEGEVVIASEQYGTVRVPFSLDVNP